MFQSAANNSQIVQQHHPSPYLRRYRLPRLSLSAAPSNCPADEEDLSPTDLHLKLELIALKNGQIKAGSSANCVAQKTENDMSRRRSMARKQSSVVEQSDVNANSKSFSRSFSLHPQIHNQLTKIDPIKGKRKASEAKSPTGKQKSPITDLRKLSQSPRPSRNDALIDVIKMHRKPSEVSFYLWKANGKPKSPTDLIRKQSQSPSTSQNCVPIDAFKTNRISSEAISLLNGMPKSPIDPRKLSQSPRPSSKNDLQNGEKETKLTELEQQSLKSKDKAKSRRKRESKSEKRK